MTARAAVIGAGSWGTALANLLADKGTETVVWSYEQDVADDINRAHLNRKYLDGIDLHPSLRATPDMARGAARRGPGALRLPLARRAAGDGAGGGSTWSPARWW